MLKIHIFKVTKIHKFGNTSQLQMQVRLSHKDCPNNNNKLTQSCSHKQQLESVAFLFTSKVTSSQGPQHSFSSKFDYCSCLS